eukprot:gene2386-507_t
MLLTRPVRQAMSERKLSSAGLQKSQGASGGLDSASDTGSDALNSPLTLQALPAKVPELPRACPPVGVPDLPPDPTEAMAIVEREHHLAAQRRKLERPSVVTAAQLQERLKLSRASLGSPLSTSASDMDTLWPRFLDRTADIGTSAQALADIPDWGLNRLREDMAFSEILARAKLRLVLARLRRVTCTSNDQAGGLTSTSSPRKQLPTFLISPQASPDLYAAPAFDTVTGSTLNTVTDASGAPAPAGSLSRVPPEANLLQASHTTPQRQAAALAVATQSLQSTVDSTPGSHQSTVYQSPATSGHDAVGPRLAFGLPLQGELDAMATPELEAYLASFPIRYTRLQHDLEKHYVPEPG